jgi:phosphatidate cytidylyltransferase
VLSAVVFLPVFLWVTARGGVPFLIFVEAVLVLGTLEMAALLDRLGLHARRESVLPAVLLLPFALERGTKTLLALVAASAALALAAALLSRARPVERVVAASLAVTLYPGLFAAMIYGLRVGVPAVEPLPGAPLVPFGAGAVFLLFLTTWGCDTAAYFTGRAVGRHALAPVVSPSKTWEGAAGGLAAALLVGWAAAVELVPGISRAQGLLIGGALGIVGQFGDLAESALKRAAAVKDASHAIPGHGGVLDRFDAIFVNAPLLYSLLVLLSGAVPDLFGMLR